MRASEESQSFAVHPPVLANLPLREICRSSEQRRQNQPELDQYMPNTWHCAIEQMNSLGMMCMSSYTHNHTKTYIAANHCSLTTLREERTQIRAEVVRHSKYVTFEMAEVTVPRDSIAVIPHHIQRLGVAPPLVQRG